MVRAINAAMYGVDLLTERQIETTRIRNKNRAAIEKYVLDRLRGHIRKSLQQTLPEIFKDDEDD